MIKLKFDLSLLSTLFKYYVVKKTEIYACLPYINNAFITGYFKNLLSLTVSSKTKQCVGFIYYNLYFIIIVILSSSILSY